jgi:hypothetical protein
MKNTVFWDGTPYVSCTNRNFGGIYRIRRMLVTVNVAPSSPILVTLMMEAIRSFDTPVLTRSNRRNIPEDGILDPRSFLLVM